MRSISQIIEYIKQNRSQLGISLNAPAYPSDIEAFERELGLTLPADIKEFYSLCNGFESNDWIFNIIPLADILTDKNMYKANEFHIAEYMIYSDEWIVKVNTDNNTYQIFEDSSKIILTNSFAEFLEFFLTGGVFEKGGLYDWKDEIEKN